MGFGAAVATTLPADGDAAAPGSGPGPPTAVAGPAQPALGCTPAPLAERAAAVLVTGLGDALEPDAPRARELVDLGVGGVLLTEANVRNAAQVRRLVGGLRARANDPLLVAAEEGPGRASTFSTILGRFSAPRVLAASGSPEDVEAFATRLGVELGNLGVDLVLGPVLDVDADAAGYIGDRAFAGDPGTVTDYGLAYTRGLRRSGVQPAPRHFPGHGRTDVDSRRARAVVAAARSALRARDLPPFAAQIDDGVRAVLVGHVVYEAVDPRRPASLSAAAYRLLRGAGFEGAAVTDVLDVPAITGERELDDAAVAAIAAGADVLVLADGARTSELRDRLVAAVRDGALSELRLTAAAARARTLAGGDPEQLTCLPGG